MSMLSLTPSIPGLLALTLGCPALLGPESCGAEAAREIRVIMGTTAEVRVRGLVDPAPTLDATFAAVTSVDSTMSLWKESELTRLNDRGHGRVSPDLLVVLRHALDVARASRGAFDPTIEPLVRATGGLVGQRRRLPARERRALVARVGFSRVQVDLATGEVTLAPGTRLDFGGIAKGYAADLGVEVLRRAGAACGLVDLGESSTGTFGEDLVLEVRDPEKPAAPPWASFRVTGAFVSTSGGDQRPGHILDPKTGLPARGVLAATVVAGTGIEADALSTAVYVLGAERGLRLLEQRGAAGFVLERSRGQRTLRPTQGFARAYGLVVALGVRVLE